MKKFVAVFAAIYLAAAAGAQTEVGKPAPDFRLKDIKGGEQALSAFKGSIVVLEWTNPECPFVQKHYNSKNMQKLQKQLAEKGVAWLTICSSAPGKQGHRSAAQWEEWLKKQGWAGKCMLIDEDGKVGRLYKASNTPHMFVIDKAGVLVYAGAIDDKATADVKDVDGAKNYVLQAVDEILAGKPVLTPETRAYGCSVKY